MRQARLALSAAGLLTQAQTAIDADTTGILGIWWDYSTIVERNNAQMLQVANTLGLTSDQIDALFVAASKL